MKKLLLRIEQIIITVGLGTATLLVFANVVARYLFETGFPWVLETVQYLFAWVVLVGAAYGVREGAHLGIDIAVEKLPPKGQRIASIGAAALSLLFVGWVWWLSVGYTMKIKKWGDLTIDLQIPQWIPYLAIPFGLGLMFLHLTVVTWKIATGEKARVAASEADAHRIEEVVG